MMRVFGAPHPSRATRVTWMLEEIGAPYDYVPVTMFDERKPAPEFTDIERRDVGLLALNPAGKVPVLVDGDLTLTESAAIITYLGDKFPESRLVPAPRTVERAHYDQWCYFAISELEEPLWTVSKHTFALPAARQVPSVVGTAKWEFERAAKVLDDGLGNREYILGDCFTGADILLGHTLFWGRRTVSALGSRSLEEYADRVLARPALARAMERTPQPNPGMKGLKQVRG